MIVGGSKVIIRARDPIMATRKKLEIMVQRKSANKGAKMLSQTGLYQTTVANISLIHISALVMTQSETLGVGVLPALRGMMLILNMILVENMTLTLLSLLISAVPVAAEKEMEELVGYTETLSQN